MKTLLYDELVPWYRLIDPVTDHEDEGTTFTEALQGGIAGRAETLLELGCGGGHSAHYVKKHFSCTLTDISEPMLALSRDLNPECEHLVGDMRSMRLERTFDAVLIHDAIVYMTTEEDLEAAFTTAFTHTRPGGAALIAPDEFRETFREQSTLIEGNDRRRHLRCIEWAWDPDPNDTCYAVDYALLLRDNGQVEAYHDVHVAGLFARATWVGLLEKVGYTVELIRRPIGGGDTDEVLLARRPK